MEIFGETFQILEKALDLRMVNHRVISSNLANVDTPGFQASRLDFQASMDLAIAEIQAAQSPPSTMDAFEELARQASIGSDPGVDPIIGPTGDEPIGLDGNNVAMEDELGALGSNSMMYQITIQMLAAQLRQIQLVLDSGGS